MKWSAVIIKLHFFTFGRYVADNGTVVGCFEKQSYCASQPCQNGGTCSNSWKTYECECADGWSGKDCSQSKYSVLK